MSSNIDKINSIPFLDVLSALWFIEWVHFILIGKTIKMKENWKITDWWIWNIDKWILTCFSWEKWDRIEWDRFELVKKKFNFSDKETFEWYENNFSISPNKKEKNMSNPILEKWNSLTSCTEEQIKYLNNRNISLVGENYKNNNGLIARAIKTINGNIIWIQSRVANDVEKKNRYRVEWIADWVFFTSLNRGNKTCYVVEWFTDVWTLEQFWVNVIWLVSASVWAKYIKEIDKIYDIIFIPDNDEAGKTSIEKFKELWINFSYYNLENFDKWVKDINELYWRIKEYWLWKEDLFQTINEWLIRKKSNLELAIERAKWLRTNWIILTWDEVIDQMTRWVTRWATFLINWASWQGKTTFSQYLLKCLITKNPWIKINYYSLETDVGRQIMQLIAFVTGNTEEYVFNNIDLFEKYLYRLNWIELFDDIWSIEEIQRHIEETNPDVAFVDFCQKVMIPWIFDETNKAIFYAQDMQNFARKHKNTAIVSLSQVAMSNYNTPILDRLPKWSGSLKESSDTLVNVWLEDWEYWLWWVKAKWIGARGFYKKSRYDFNHFTNEVKIHPPEDLKNKKFWWL